jgi:hypothetical protein
MARGPETHIADRVAGGLSKKPAWFRIQANPAHLAENDEPACVAVFRRAPKIFPRNGNARLKSARFLPSRPLNF